MLSSDLLVLYILTRVYFSAGASSLYKMMIFFPLDTLPENIVSGSDGACAVRLLELLASSSPVAAAQSLPATAAVAAAHCCLNEGTSGWQLVMPTCCSSHSQHIGTLPIPSPPVNVCAVSCQDVGAICSRPGRQ